MSHHLTKLERIGAVRKVKVERNVRIEPTIWKNYCGCYYMPDFLESTLKLDTKFEKIENDFSLKSSKLSLEVERTLEGFLINQDLLQASPSDPFPSTSDRPELR